MRKGGGDWSDETYFWNYATTGRTSYVTERVGIRPYMRNDLLHMMLEMEYIMPMIPTLEMYYLVHCFQICRWVGVAPPMLGAHIIED